ncbi:MAG: PilZ domain-containing protein [Wenzhouxiangella sp.]|jgi:hypothetical protein|nr:PilZ domain-containing protein [Wenzhouxiangella sp.]
MIDYEDRLVVAWEVDETLGEQDMAQLEGSNLAVLQGVAAVEEGGSHRLREEQPELYQEIERLNARLDLLIDMVGRLNAEQREEGATRRVRLAVDHVEFVATPQDAEPGQNGCLNLQLHMSVPEPLRLPGQVVSERTDQANRRWVRFEPFAMSTRLHDALDQLIFRHHRRTIAEQRSRLKTG